MTSPESQSQPIRLGISRENLNLQIIEDILRIYFITGGPKDYERPYIEEDSKRISRILDGELRPGHSYTELRYGSRFTPNSKLVVSKEPGGLLSFEFMPNMVPGDWGYDEAQLVPDQFRDNIESYLYGAGVAQPIIY